MLIKNENNVNKIPLSTEGGEGQGVRLFNYREPFELESGKLLSGFSYYDVCYQGKSKVQFTTCTQ